MKKLLFTFLLCLILTTSVSGQFFAPNQKPSLGLQVNLAHPLAPTAVWLFNEGSGGQVFDLSGNGNTGTFAGNTAWVSGKFGSAINFPGAAGDHISIADNPTISGLSIMSFGCWLNISSKTDNMQIMFKGGNEIAELEYTITYILSTDRLRFYTGNGTSVDSLEAATFGSPSLNTWYHIYCVLNNGNRSIYVNGILSDSDSTALYGNDDATGLGIGEALSGGSKPFVGKIDLPRVHNRALTLNEIALLYREPFCYMQPVWNWSLYSAISVTPTGQVIFINTR